MKILTDIIAVISKEEKLSPPFAPLTRFPLVIVVGLTGVGKSTVIEALQNDVDFTLLPNRREITDDVIIAPLQQADGHPPQIVADRIKRFEYTARYRAEYPGGMAHALSRLAINPTQVSPLLIFDGLRGLNEVEHAVAYFPQARFIVLDAPDTVRLSRLLQRADAFDAAKIQLSAANQDLMTRLMSIQDIESVFSREQLQQLAQVAHTVDMSTNEVIKKVSIIAEERRNYDSGAAREYLTGALPARQALVVDTATQSPQAVAERVKAWV